MRKLQPVRGTQDFLPGNMLKYRTICDSANKTVRLYGFEEVATPVLEQTALFARSIGEETDVVSKEMYSFPSRSGNENLSLRPENTAGIARAFISNGLTQSVPIKHFYSGPMFRYERPQKGRYRQFHQIGVELIGSDSPLADVEIIACGAAVLREIGLLKRLVLKLNSLGDSESRSHFRARLVSYFSDNLANLSPESRNRLKYNPLRILDSKDKGDQILIQEAPRLGNSLNNFSSDFFSAVQQGLKDLGIEFTLDDRLVRGLDYYTHTAFEFTTHELGAQSGVLGGGRYDNLIARLGGGDTPGVGWASGVERLMLLADITPESPDCLALVPLGDVAERWAVAEAERLRHRGFIVDMAYKGNLTRRLKRANKISAKYALILGDNELSEGQAIVRNLSQGQQEKIKLDEIDQYLDERLSKP